MDIDVPQPPDEEFEERLSWSPFPNADRARRGGVSDPTTASAAGPARVGGDGHLGPVRAPVEGQGFQPNPTMADRVTVVDPRPVDLAPVDGGDGPRVGRFVVEAYDRLADRVLERLRALREDVDASLAEMRSELGSLRRAVDDVGDRVQLRQLRLTIDELRGDVSGLRRAVIEWPELEQVSGDVAALRAGMSELLGQDATGRDAADPKALDALRVEVGEVRRMLEKSAALPAFGPLIEEVSALRAEVSSLRRRIALRAVGGKADLGDDHRVELSEEQLQRLIVALEARLVGREEPGRRARVR